MMYDALITILDNDDARGDGPLRKVLFRNVAYCDCELNCGRRQKADV